MAYRVLMELVPRPDSIQEWMWDEQDEERGVATNGHADFKHQTGGKAWTGKLAASDTVWEYSNETSASAKMAQLDSADSTNRRYKVVEV
jgi:hypothetical protein